VKVEGVKWGSIVFCLAFFSVFAVVVSSQAFVMTPMTTTVKRRALDRLSAVCVGRTLAPLAKPRRSRVFFVAISVTTHTFKLLSRAPTFNNHIGDVDWRVVTFDGSATLAENPAQPIPATTHLVVT